MSIKSELTKITSYLRSARKAILGRGGEISPTAGLKDLPDAIYAIPADSSLAFQTDDSAAYQKVVPSGAEEYAQVSKIGGMTYKSKNLFDDAIFESSGLAKVGEHEYHASHPVYIGFPSMESFDYALKVFDNPSRESGSFTVSMTVKHVHYNEYSYRGMCPAVVYTDGSIVYPDVGSGDGFNDSLHNKYYNYKQTTDPNKTVDYIAFVVGSSDTDTYIKNFQIEKGAVATEYTPFGCLRDSKVTELNSHGANLCIPNKKTVTENGYTVTTNADGSVTVTGASTSDGPIYLDLALIGADGQKQPVVLTQGVTYNIGSTGGSKVVSVKIDYTDEEGGTKWGGLSSSDNTRPRKISKVYIEDSAATIGSTTLCGTYYIMLNVGSTSLPYKPYIGTIETKVIPEAMQALDGYGRGIDEKCNDYIEWRGSRVYYCKKVDVVDLGTLTWSGDTRSYWASVQNLKPPSSAADRQKGILCAQYPVSTVVDTTKLDNKAIVRVIHSGYSIARIYLKDEDYTTANALKTALSGVMLYYELAEPIETDITDLITTDNFIKVEEGGVITAVNEYGYDTPSTINYITKVG